MVCAGVASIVEMNDILKTAEIADMKSSQGRLMRVSQHTMKGPQIQSKNDDDIKLSHPHSPLVLREHEKDFEKHDITLSVSQSQSPAHPLPPAGVDTTDRHEGGTPIANNIVTATRGIDYQRSDSSRNSRKKISKSERMSKYSKKNSTNTSRSQDSTQYRKDSTKKQETDMVDVQQPSSESQVRLLRRNRSFTPPQPRTHLQQSQNNRSYHKSESEGVERRRTSPWAREQQSHRRIKSWEDDVILPRADSPFAPIHPDVSIDKKQQSSFVTQSPAYAHQPQQSHRQPFQQMHHNQHQQQWAQQQQQQQRPGNIHPHQTRSRHVQHFPIQQSHHFGEQQQQKQQQQQQQPQQQQNDHQHAYFHSQPSPSVTPPRMHVESNKFTPSPRHHQSQPYHQPHSHHYTKSSPPHRPSPPSHQNRSPPDVLKTLLRKKACLYETDTSRAIALVTWLVGKSLAIKHGYFSRQQLQSGVHRVVSSKISAGVITRTKVNRCMQIILNCCFHYIIPRPDGAEENGELFRKMFETEVGNDDHLVKELPLPWNDLDVNGALDGWDGDDAYDSTSRANEPGEKRTVLLSFNENVRSSNDVWRCHNEFIRDAANAANLYLKADEWRVFFAGRSDIKDSGESGESTPSSGSPNWKQPPSHPDNVTPLSLPAAMSWRLQQDMSDYQSVGNANSYEEDPEDINIDETFGQMNPVELNKFRTSWCAKRYDHDWTKCGFAHVDINRGWLRRDPTRYSYSSKICPHIHPITTTIDNNALEGCLLNACPMGVHCCYAHSQEEVDYHPDRYKKNICTYARGKSLINCPLRDVCPHSHPIQEDDAAYSRPSAETTSPHTRSPRSVPTGAPMMYVTPSPESDFDKSLMLPGLRGLFRRRCSTLHAHICGGRQTCLYNHFGDDCGIEKDVKENVIPSRFPKMR